MLKKLVTGMFIIFFSLDVLASDVFIETDMEFGRGMLRQVGNECLVYTPKHVIADTQDIYVSSRFKKDIQASLLTTYPQDLAVLLLPQSEIEVCNESTWKDGGTRVAAILNSAKNAKLSFRKKNGGLTEYDLQIVQKDIHTYFYVKLSDSNKAIKQGMSGSTVYLGGYAIGMLISVADGVGKVLRLDDITNISQSVVSNYESELEKIERQSGVASTREKSKPSKTIHAVLNNQHTNFKGNIADGDVKKFKILATGNTAYKLTNIPQSGKNTINVDFYSPGESKKLYSSKRIRVDRNESFGFGTTFAGEHTLYVYGIKGVGSFNLKLEEIATTDELVGEANFLSSGDHVKGSISKGTEARYTILAKGNTAYKLTNIPQSDKNTINVAFYSPGESKKLYSSKRIRVDRNESFGFGTTFAGEHTLYVYGIKGVGSFNLKLEEIATTDELVGEANFLSSGDHVKGSISKGTWAKYKIQSKGNTSYRLTNIKQSGNNTINVAFYSPGESKKLYSSKRIRVDRNESFGFGTTFAGEHTLYVYGVKGVGSFNLKFEEVNN
ncbi:hypothetical protein [Colwellia sp. MEBiC06753]